MHVADEVLQSKQSDKFQLVESLEKGIEVNGSEISASI
jgi:tmRNA-binding protein